MRQPTLQILALLSTAVTTAGGFAVWVQTPTTRSSATATGTTTTTTTSKSQTAAPFRRHHQPSFCRLSSSSSSSPSSSSSESQQSVEELGLNELHTLLVEAALSNQFVEASAYSDEMLRRLSADHPPQNDEEKRARKLRMSWPGLGTADWLTDRLFDLNYTFPTTVQINALEAVNAILNVPDEIMSTTTLGERVDMSNKDMGVVVSGTTGSGKTLSYLIPTLSTLSDSLFVRQRIRVGDEEKVLGDTAADFAARVMATTQPELRTPGGQQRRGGISTGAALSTLGSSGSDVTKPLVLIVVPTRELGTQVAADVYQLVGGTVGKEKSELEKAMKVCLIQWVLSIQCQSRNDTKPNHKSVDHSLFCRRRRRRHWQP